MSDSPYSVLILTYKHLDTCVFLKIFGSHWLQFAEAQISNPSRFNFLDKIF